MTLALVVSVIAVVSYAGLAVIVIRRGLRIRVNRLFALYLAAMLVWQLANIQLSLSETAGAALLWYRVMIAAAAGQFIVFFYFARAALHIRERRRVVLLGCMVWLVTVLALVTDERHFLTDVARHPSTGLFVPRFGPVLLLIAFSIYAFLGYGIATLVRGYRRATVDLERSRLRYLLLSIVIIVLGTLANFIPPLQAYPVEVTANIISALLFSYAIMRYRLLDITFFVRRGLAYSILTAAIAAMYLLGILLFERLVQSVVGLGAFLVPILLAMVAAVLLQPWRDRAQAWVDQLLFREKYDSRRMLQELSRRTATLIELEPLGTMLLSEICDTMHLERAALLRKEESTGDFAIAAQRGLDRRAAAVRLTSDHPIVQWLLRSERLLHAGEIDLLPEFRSLWARERDELNLLGAQLLIPLIVKNDLVGILIFGPKLSGEAYAWDEEVTLSTLANQTAVAVENARLFAATKARVAELTALQEIGGQLVSSRSLPSVLQVVAESGIRLLRSDEAHVALYDSAAGRFGMSHSATADGSAATLPAVPAAATLLQTAVARGKPAIIGDLWLHAAIPPALARGSRMRAIAACPLRREEKTIGVLAAVYYQAHSFPEEELPLLGMLAGQATLAIDNAQLLESEQAKRQLADTLREVSRVIGSTLEFEVLVGLVLEQLRRVVDYDVAAILLLSGNRLEVSSASSFPDREQFIGLTFELDQHPLFAALIRQGRPLMSNDVQQDRRWIEPPSGPRLRAFIGVPLVLREEPRGLLIMGKEQPSRYGDDDLQNAIVFANQVAIAIENARLYQETIAEKRKTETILREALSGIVVTDVELRIVSFNSGAESITGYDARQVVGRRLPDVLGPEIALPNSPLGRVQATGQRVPPQETVIQTASGLRDILQGTVALHDANQNLFGYLVTFADITRLKEVDRLKTDIVANVSHELRTPLASIKAYTELLLDNIEGEDRQLRDQFLRIIDQETDRLSELISDLLDLSRLEAGRFEVRKVAIDVPELLSDVLTVLDVQRRGRGLSIHTEIPEGLPALIADREMVAIILKNLVGNAIKFSRPGGSVLIALRNSPEHLELQVTDHGIGIPAEAMPHLFQKFYRVQSTSESGIEGTGLGLVLTKEAVEAHGGSIEVESEVGVQTTFTVRLPWR